MMEEDTNRAEALLIATVNPLTKGEISAALQVDNKSVSKILRLLKKRYEGTALEIKTIGKKYKIAVKDKYSDLAFKYSENELDKGELEIIALLFSKKRVYMSHVERLRGKKAQAEVDHLVKLGFVDVERVGNRRIVKLTRLFLSRYGRQIREKLEKGDKV
ncbi:MAG: SMC-Scp complex subunit ScpB [Thermoplasmatales archaeon]